MINVCYQNNSDKIIAYRYNKNEVLKRLLIKFTQFTYSFFFPYPLLIICGLNPHTIITNLSIFLSICCSILIMAALHLQIFSFTSADAWHHNYIYLKKEFSKRVFSIWIHSFPRQYYDRTIVSSRWVFCRMWVKASSVNVLHPLVSLGNPVAAYVFFRVFLSLLSFHLSFTQKF